MKLVAFIGRPGAGKSTSAGVLAGLQHITRIPLALPLYDIQRAFYERVGVSPEEGQQDGEILNFLGSHFRSVEPAFMLDDFEERLSYAALSSPDLVLCDDARPRDINGLRSLGFSVVQIVAPDELRLARKGQRGDVRAGNESHPTELGDFTADYVVMNDGDIATLTERLTAVVESIPEARQLAPAQDAAQHLFARAKAEIVKMYAPSRHQIASAVLTERGSVFVGVHVETIIGRASICAESVAIGKALMSRSGKIAMVVTVRHPRPDQAGEVSVVPPCGICREVLSDWGSSALVAVSGPNPIDLMAPSELLPRKYVGSKWNSEVLA